jgi:arsenite-transporting ATPase
VSSGTRVVLFTGKGGVGKTTVAASTAVAAAAAGRRTLVVSTDAAHSLGDALGVSLGDEPRQVADGLFAQQLDAQQRLESSWGEVRTWLTELFDWAGLDGIEAEELAVLPGLDELFALADLRDHAESGEWDLVVVDCAPTAETIRLLALPEILAWYMGRVFPVTRQVNRVVAPLLSKVSNLPVAGDDVYGAAARFYLRLDGVRELLSDVERSSVRIVLTPERVVLAESRRTHTYLSLYGYAVDAVVVNRRLPEAVSDPWFDGWRSAEHDVLADVDDEFAPVPVLPLELASAEPVGVDALGALAAELYGEVDPVAVLHRDEGMTVERRGDEATLELPLPFADHDDLELGRRGDDLLVRVGPHRRSITLPDSLRGRRVEGAVLRSGRLRVTLVPGGSGGPDPLGDDDGG